MSAPHPIVRWPLRAWRGVTSSFAAPLLPVGGWWIGRARRQGASLERLKQGIAIVLPGIEGAGPLSWNICKGLEDGGFRGEVVLQDWTTGLWPLFLYHLRGRKRNRTRAAGLAGFIRGYRHVFPTQPVFLIGHSGGGAMTAWILETMPSIDFVTAAVMLGPALSHNYDLSAAFGQVKTQLWNFWSYGDAFLCAGGTLACGCLDGKHTLSAGFRGFSTPSDPAKRVLYDQKLRQVCWSPRFAKQFHFGGHFGLANRVFVAETIAPILNAPESVGPALA